MNRDCKNLSEQGNERTGDHIEVCKATCIEVACDGRQSKCSYPQHFEKSDQTVMDFFLNGPDSDSLCFKQFQKMCHARPYIY